MNTDLMIPKIQSVILENPRDPGPYRDMLDVLHYLIEEDAKRGHELNKALRPQIVTAMKLGGDMRTMSEFNRLNKRSLLMDAKVDFDASLQ